MSDLEKFKHCSTQVNLSPGEQSMIVDAGKELIPDADLAGKGRELFPHTTCKYGVLNAPELLAKVLSLYQPFTMTLGGVVAFDVSEHSEGAAPIVVEVKSPELEQLHQDIDLAMASKPDDFSYRPHLTLAYVLPESAKKFEGSQVLAGLQIKVTSIALSDPDGHQTEFPLGVEAAKVRKADDDSDADDMAEEINEAIAYEWEQLPTEIRHQLEEAFSVGLTKGVAELNVSDVAVISSLNQAAMDWAAERAAEMVGMKWGPDGTLIPNPDAKWQISETTRNDIRQIVKDAFADETKMADLESSIRDAGAFSESRAAMIAKTEVKFAQVGGNAEAWKQSGLVKKLAWLMSADHEIPCDCEDNEDEVVEFGEPFPSGDFYPPVHPRCVLGDTVIASCDRITAYYRRWFEGEVLAIKCFDGTEVSITPNHPVLTTHGWVAAGELAQGDELLKCSAERYVSFAKHPNDKLMPSVAEQVFSALLKSDSVTAIRVPSSTEDFHGDGTVDGEVSIVWPDGGLTSKRNAAGSEQLSESGLVRGDCRRALLNADSLSAEESLRFLDAADSIVRSARTSRPAVGGLSGGLSPTGVAERSDWQAGELESPSDRYASNADSLSNINARFASEITSVKIREISRSEWRGHVYNLGTQSGYYSANGLIIHNCECSVMAAVIEGLG